MSTPTKLHEPPDLSLVLGGPLFQIFRRAHLSGPTLELLQRRVLSISLFAWLPLAILTAIEGHLRGGQSLTFAGDIESHVRFLVALPLFLAAELIVHTRIRPVVRLFVERRIIAAEDMPRFYAAIDSALRARNSVWLELALLLFVYVVGHLFWQHKVALGAATWYAMPDATGIHLTLAGYWYSFVSIPIFQFIFLRWYLRLGIWFLFLWHTSRLKLRLLPAHPDRAGGIGFLGAISYAFSPVLLAQGTLIGGADRQPDLLPAAEPAVIQNDDYHAGWIFRSSDSWSACHLHASSSAGQKKWLGKLRNLSDSLCERFR